MPFDAGGAAATVRASAAVCVNEAAVPVNVTVAFPVAALPAAVRVTFCGVPGVRLKLDGSAVTPDGRPLKATWTVALNPFAGSAFTEITSPVAPCVNVRLGGVRVRVKSFGFAGAAFTASLRLAV